MGPFLSRSVLPFPYNHDNKHLQTTKQTRNEQQRCVRWVLFCLDLCCPFHTITTTNTYKLQNRHETNSKDVLDGSFSVSICVALSIQSRQQTLTGYKTDTKRTAKMCYTDPFLSRSVLLFRYNHD